MPGKKLTLKEKIIKCVVVGDSGVGKTKLISSFVYDKPEIDVSELNSLAHTPSIFGSDIKEDKLLNRLRFSFGGKSLQLQIQDTFGCHTRDRVYCYNRADVVIICFNIGLYSSLENVLSVWSKEVKLRCPRAPVILVGTQLDRRHNDASKYCHKTKHIKSLRNYLSGGSSTSEPNDFKLVEAEEARSVLKKINGDLYMEASVASKYGVNELFKKAAIMAYFNERKSHSRSFLQQPYLPTKVLEPKIDVPSLNLGNVFFSAFFSPFVSTATVDVEFQLKDGTVYGHCAILMLTSKLFREFFEGIWFATDGCKHWNGDSIIMEQCFCNGVSCCLPRGFNAVNCNFEDKFLLKVEVGGVNATDLAQILEFYYTGNIETPTDPISLLNAANYLQVDLAFEYINNIVTGQPFESTDIQWRLATDILTTGKMLMSYNENKDVHCLVDGIFLPCHKVILMQRCRFFFAAFGHNNTLEAELCKVDFKDTNLESFLAVLEYLYTGDCQYYGDLHGTLQLANFLCLPRLVALCEKEIARYITELHEKGDKGVYAAAIASYSVAQFHNAAQLADWCIHFMATNYNGLCKEESKGLKSLEKSTLKYLEEHRWPPVWYLKERDYYDRTMRQLEEEQSLKKTKKRHIRCF